MRDGNPDTRRVLTRTGAVELVSRLRAGGSRVVFTNGVFDLLHPGHVRYLAAARALGDALIVGLNSDASVRRNKGPDRPINPEAERAEVVAALDCVDAVALFEESTPARIIADLQPDVLVKGADWPEDNIVGRDTVEARGGRVVRMDIEPGYSTTAIVDRVRAFTGAPHERRFTPRDESARAHGLAEDHEDHEGQ